MSIIIDLSPQELAALKQLTKLEDDAEAVVRAAREFLRLSRPRVLSAASGKNDLDLNWQKLEEREHAE